MRGHASPDRAAPAGFGVPPSACRVAVIVWIALVVPPAVLLLAVLLQRLEAAVLATPAEPDPHDTVTDLPDLTEPTDPPGTASLALVPDPVPPAARPVCATHRRRARTTRATA